MHRRLLNSLSFGIPLLYYASLNSSIIFCHYLGEIYLSSGIPLITSSDCDFFEGFSVILSAILLPIKSPVAFAVSLSIFFTSSFNLNRFLYPLKIYYIYH